MSFKAFVVGAIPAGRPIASGNGSNTGEPMASPLHWVCEIR